MYESKFQRYPLWFKKLIDICILLYIISIYIFSFSTESNIISKILAAILMVLIVIFVLINGSFKINRVVSFFAFFVLFCLLSSLWAVNQDTALSMVSTLGQIFLLFFLLYNYFCFTDNMEYLIQVVCISGTVFAIYTVSYFGVEEYFAGLEDGLRMGAGEINVNVIGMSTASSAIIALWYMFFEKRYWYSVAVVICSITALGSGSRKALLSLMLGVLFLFILKGDSKKKLISVVEGIVLLVVLYFVLKMPIFGTTGDRFQSMLNAFIGEGKVDGSTNIRLEMIRVGFKQFFEAPFTGVGIGNSNYITLMYFNWNTYLHNNYVELLASVGVFGTVLYYLMYAEPLLQIIKPAFKQNKFAILAFCLLMLELILQYGTVQYYSKTAYISLLLFSLIAERMKKIDA